MIAQLLFLPFSRKLSFHDNELDIDMDNTVESQDKVFFMKIMDVDGVLGQIKVENDVYLLFVQGSKLVFDSADSKVHKVEKIKAINLSEIKLLYENDHISIQERQMNLECDDILKKIKCKSKEMKNFLNFLDNSPFYVSDKKIEDDKYLWNKHMISQLDGSTKNSNGFLFLYNGYFEMRACSHYKYFIMSIISSNRIGPRYLSRGVDTDGNVSNFVKTRYFVEKDEEIKLNVIIYRGSVPIFWDQSGSLREVNFDSKDSFIACFKHFYSNFRDTSKDSKIEKVPDPLPSDGKFYRSVDHFNNILVINLLSSKKDEKRLTKFYIELLDSLEIQNFTFDLNKHHLNYQKLKALFIEALHTNIMWIEERMLIKKSKIEKITFRVNCLDCLDRTNLASYLICDYYHSKLGIPKFHLKSLFQENGNVISLFNAGSHALKSELAVKEKRSIKGMVDDFYIYTKRAIHDKFNDKQKMEYIDLLLGKMSNTNSLEEPDFGKIVQIPDQDTGKENFILITMKISSRKDLKNLTFNPLESTSLIILCINKIVNTFMSVFVDETVDFSIPNFVLVSKKSSQNIHILIFTRENCVEKISDILYTHKKRGLQIRKKNSCVSVSFLFNMREFIIYNVITDKITDIGVFDSKKIENEDVYIITGIFSTKNSSDIFDELECNYIETRNEIKVAFKGRVIGKDFQEYPNVNFFTFTI